MRIQDGVRVWRTARTSYLESGPTRRGPGPGVSQMRFNGGRERTPAWNKGAGRHGDFVCGEGEVAINSVAHTSKGLPKGASEQMDLGSTEGGPGLPPASTAGQSLR